jgi:hypothetical protein
MTKMKGGEKAPDLKAKEDDPKQAKSLMSQYEAINAADKAMYELRNNLRTRSLADDVEYWDAIASMANRTNGDHEKAMMKLAQAKLAVMKKDVTEGRAVSDEVINEAERVGLSKLELAKSANESMLALGAINAGELIQLERELEDQRIEIQRAAQTARIAMVESDPNHSPAALMKEKDKLLEVERAYQLKIQGLQQKKALDDSRYSREFQGSMESGFAGVLKSFSTGTMTIRQLFRNLGKSIYESMAGVFANIAAKWLASQLMQKVGAAITAAQGVAANAAVAGAAAFAATAAIPYVGPVLAPEAAAMAYAGAMSFMGAIPAAAKGFDIPAGMNPITQLHEKEMVLPQAQADAVRDMANGGGSGTIHIHGSPDDSIKLRDLPKVLKKLNRNFAFVR